MSKPKLCKYCKWCRPVGVIPIADVAEAMCVHPRLDYVPNNEFLVHGQITRDAPIHRCVWHRAVGWYTAWLWMMCGKRGKWWEAN